MFRHNRKMSNKVSRPKQLRIGLRFQIALLGIAGVVLTGAVCLVGLHSGANAQREADESTKLQSHVAGLSESYLAARHISAYR